MNGCQRMMGYVVALFVLVGRWTPGRLGEEEQTGTFLVEPRFWTVVAAIVLTCLLLSRKQRRVASTFRPPTKRAAGLSVLFLAYIVLSSLWAPDWGMACDKSYEVLLLLVMVLCLAITLRLDGVEDFRFAFWSLLVFLTGIMALSALFLARGDRLAVFGGGPNVFGRNMGLMILGVLYLRPRFNAAAAFCWVPLMALGCLLIVMSGSRGALVAALAAGAVYLLADKMSVVGKALVVAAAAGVVWIALAHTSLGAAVSEMFRSRVTELTIEQKYTSGREDLVLDAFELIAERPWLGYGVSGFRAIVGMYPHNIFLETTAETGLVGTALLCMILLTAGRTTWRQRVLLSGPTVAAFAHALVACQLSGDMFDSRGVFVLLLLSLIPDLKQATARKLRPAPLAVRPTRQPLPQSIRRHPQLTATSSN